MHRKAAVLTTLVLLTLLAAGCSRGYISGGEKTATAAPPPASWMLYQPAGGMVQSSEGGAVTIDVEWLGEENGSLGFSVALNTHSVGLDGYDLGELAVLRDDAGVEYRPVGWDAASGGHHRRGYLAFPVPDSLRQGQAAYIEMVIHDVAGVPERVMHWEM